MVALYFLILLMAVPAWAVTRYVDLTCGDIAIYSPTQTGAARCTGGTATNRNTIAEGIALTQAGDVLLIRAGTYLESPIRSDQVTFHNGSALCPPGSATCATAPVFSGYQNERPIIRWGINFDIATTQYQIWRNLILDGNTEANQSGMDINGHHLRFEGMEIRNYLKDGISSQAVAHHLEVINCNIHNNGNATTHLNHGLYWVASDSLLDGNEIHHNNALGIQIQNADPGLGSHRNIFRNNKVHHNVDQGVVIDGEDNQVYNNVVYENATQGIHLFPVGGPQPANTTKNTIVFNNTVYNNGGPGIAFGLTQSNSTFSNIVRNNFVFNNGSPGNIHAYAGNTNQTFSNNLCNSLTFGCTQATTNPGFQAASSGDFHLLAGSPAIGAGVQLNSFFTTDAEGVVRGTTWDIGAYEFQGSQPPEPSPIGLVGEWLFIANANDSTGNHHGTFQGDAGVAAPGILGMQALQLDGNGDYVTVAPHANLRPTTQWGISLWLSMNTLDPGGCTLGSVANSLGLFLGSTGRPAAWIFGTSYVEAMGLASIIPALNLHIAATYKNTGEGLRVYVDGAQVAFTPTTQTIAYPLGTEAWQMGRFMTDGNSECHGAISHFRFYDEYLTPQAIANLKAEGAAIPAQDIFAPHMRFFAADEVEGVPASVVDGNLVISRNQKIGVRWALRRGSGTAGGQHFSLWCGINTANAAAFRKLTGSCSAFPLCIAEDTAVSMGNPTTVLLPTEGFSPKAGYFEADTPDEGVQVLIATGEQVEIEWRIFLSTALQDGDVIRCEPRS